MSWFNALNAVVKSNAGRGRKARLPALVTLLGMAGTGMEAVAWFNPEPLQSRGDAAPPARPVWIAQISDPHLFEENKRETWLSDEREDRRAFARALAFLNVRAAAEGRVPDALVITGDLGVDPTFLPGRGAANAVTRDQQVGLIARMLRASPVRHVFVVAGNNDVADERPDPAALAAFHSLIGEVNASLNGSGVEVQDLTACYSSRDPGRTTGCFADLPGGVRLIGFASATFKNKSRVAGSNLLQYEERQRESTATINRPFDTRAVQRLTRLVASATRAGKRALILTHEPDLDDPYALDVLTAGPLPDSAATYDPAVWNVDRQVRLEWVRAATSPTVIGVLAGHFHSWKRDDYIQPYRSWAVDRSWSTDERMSPERLFVSPPLAIKNQNDKPAQARGISLYRIVGDDVHRDIAWYDRERGFTTLQSEPPTKPTGTASSATNDDVDRPDRMGVVVFAILAATGAMLMAYKRGFREWKDELLTLGPNAPTLTPAPQTPRISIEPGTDAPGATASTHEVDSMDVFFKLPVPREEPKFPWLSHLSYVWLIVWGLGGLVLALLFFADRWTDRDIVAFWYTLGFTVWALLMWIVMRLLK